MRRIIHKPQPNRTNWKHCRALLRRALFFGVPIAMVSVGCSSLSSVKDGASSLVALSNSSNETPGEIITPDNEQRVSNPQATEIRFDGQELVLGGGECQSMSVSRLRDVTNDLRKRGRDRSASETVRLHRRSASRWFMESVANPTSDEAILWVAKTLDGDSSASNHEQFYHATKAAPQEAKAFSNARSTCIQMIASGAPAGKPIEELRQSAEQLNTPLASLEAERLTAMSEVVSGNAAAAATRLAAAADFAAQFGVSDQCAQLWLLAAEAHLRAESIADSGQAWHNAVRAQLAAMTSQNGGQAALPALDTVFWEQADRIRPPEVDFPREVALAMNSWKLRIGIGANLPMSPKASLWSAVAANQLTLGQPHLATLSIKRAEVEAADAAKPWLQVALARSMAAQGQTPVATTLLGSLSAHADPNVRAASLAALGSIKVQAGAYKQGSRFLIEALAMEEASEWHGRLAAEADLANVRLIVGDVQQARDALHVVQQKLAVDGRWQSLVQSLENEAAILEIEDDRNQVREIRQRISELEGNLS